MSLTPQVDTLAGGGGSAYDNNGEPICIDDLTQKLRRWRELTLVLHASFRFRYFSMIESRLKRIVVDTSVVASSNSSSSSSTASTDKHLMVDEMLKFRALTKFRVAAQALIAVQRFKLAVHIFEEDATPLGFAIGEDQLQGGDGTEGSEIQSASPMLKLDFSQNSGLTHESTGGEGLHEGGIVSVFGHPPPRNVNHETRMEEPCVQSISSTLKDGNRHCTSFNQHSRGEDEDEEKGNKSTSKTSVNEKLQFRADIQCLGFTKWDQDFNPSRIVVLVDVTDVEEQVQLVFFHVEAMISLFGIGLPYSKTSISLETQEILIEQMTEESWKNFWTTSYVGSLKPFLFERTKTVQGDPKAFETEVLHLDQNEALSKFGISIDGPQVQEFVKLREASTVTGGTNNWEPSWKSWITGVIHHMVPTSMFTHGLQQKMQNLAVGILTGTDETSGDAKPKLDLEADVPVGQEKGLVVRVTFVGPKCPFFEDSPDRNSAVEIVGGDNDLPEGISLMKPTLTVTFLRASEQNQVKTTLEVNYEMGTQGPNWLAGWFQDDIRLSFRSEGNNNMQDRQNRNRIVSEVESREIETTQQYGLAKSSQGGSSGEGGIQGGVQGSVLGLSSNLSLNVKGGGQSGSTNQSTANDQSKYKSTQVVLKNHQSFGISDHSVGNRMEYEASFWPAQNPSLHFYHNSWKYAKGTGLQSKVDIEVEATWDLFGEGVEKYVLQASKKLTKCRSTASKIVAGSDVTEKIILQIFSAKLSLNHNFSEIFQLYQKPHYHWRLMNQASPNPVPRALDKTP